MNNLFKERACLTPEEIKQYVQNQLTKDEHLEVENHLIDCPFCSDALEGFASLKNPEEAASLLKDLNTRLEEKNQPSLPRKSAISLRLMVLRAAAALLILGIPIGIVMYWGESKNQRLYAAYFETGKSDFDYSSRTTDSSVMFQEPFFNALQRYDSKEFGKSLILLREHLRDSTTDAKAHFYAGVSYLKTGQTEKANEHLEMVLEQSTAPEAEVLWYLALTKLKQGDTERAKSLLGALTQSKNYYNTKASELLIQLK